ncbi:MAG: YkgJ family cysteine cluster protein [archaeon]|jgi:Fe-S-cluster containining protein
MVLTKKQESDMCLSCGECCKRYSITLLPEDVEKIAKKLKISKRVFLETHCELFVKIYPKSTPGILTFPTAFFPKRIGEILSSDLSYLPPSFFILPQIALKRVNGICRYLNKDNTCKIYKDRPDPCRLFPFMVVPGYEEQYPFCELFRKGYKDSTKESTIFAKKMQKYFKKIDKDGFANVWKNYPKAGKLFLSDMLTGGISINQLTKMTQKLK